MNRRERLLGAIPAPRPSARLTASKAAPGGFVMTARSAGPKGRGQGWAEQ